MDFISFLDKLKVGGKLSKGLYLAIFEEIHAKVFLEGLYELLNRFMFYIPSSIWQGMTALVNSKVGVDPKDHVSLLVKSHMIVRYDKISVLLGKLLICFEQRDGLVYFFLMRKPSDLREKRLGIHTHTNLDIFMEIPKQPDVWNVGNVKMHSFEDS